MNNTTKILLQATVKGRRIILRAPMPSDAHHVAEYWFGAASAHLLPYTDVTALGKKEEFLARMQKAFAEFSSEGPWSVLVGEVDGRPSGNVLINGLVPEEEAMVHVHIWDPSLRRTGIASELAGKVFEYFLDAFKLKRLVLQVPTDNAPVIRLLESLGLESQGTFFGKAAPICKEGNYSRFLITREFKPNR
jgi:RimJ/RimL family protein N-acetyltransferase